MGFSGTNRKKPHLKLSAIQAENSTATNNFITSKFLRPSELAPELGVSERTLSRWYAMGIGPPRIIRCKQVFYRKSAVLEWLIEAEVRPPRN